LINFFILFIGLDLSSMDDMTRIIAIVFISIDFLIFLFTIWVFIEMRYTITRHGIGVDSAEKTEQGHRHANQF